MSYQYSLNMFTRSTKALSKSADALSAQLTLAPFYDFEHFSCMALSIFTDIYNALANLLLALCSVPIALYSFCVDDSSKAV